MKRPMCLYLVVALSTLGSIARPAFAAGSENCIDFVYRGPSPYLILNNHCPLPVGVYYSFNNASAHFAMIAPHDSATTTIPKREIRRADYHTNDPGNFMLGACNQGFWPYDVATEQVWQPSGKLYRCERPH